MNLSSFESLSSEVFDALAQYLEAKDVVKLLTSGNRFLIASIQARGSLSRIQATFTRAPLKWPDFFARQHRLRHLHVQYATGLFPQTSGRVFTTQTLKALPKTLISIHLGLVTAESAWLGSDGGFAFEINSVFPSLQKISLCGQPSWTDPLLRCLPTSLLVLRLHNNDLITKTALLDLPRGLEELVIPKAHCAWCDNLNEVLPSRIQVLSLCGVKPTSDTVSRLRELSELKSLSLVFPTTPSCRLDNEVLGEVSKVLGELPSTLTSLTLASQNSIGPIHIPRPSTDVNPLPMCLKTLTLRDTPTQLHIPFLELPSSLTALEITPNFNSYHSGFHVAEQASLPRILSRPMVLVEFKPESLRHLPKSLTYLDISRTNLPPSDFLFLPPSLTFLQFCMVKDLDPADLLPTLPQSLQIMRVQGLTLQARQLMLLPSTINEIILFQILIDDAFIFDLLDEKSEVFKRQKSLQKFSVFSDKEIILCALKVLPLAYHTWKPLPWKCTFTSEVLLSLPDSICEWDGLDSIEPGSNQPELSSLPSQLTSIYLRKASCFWPSEESATLQWPPKLTNLHLPVDYSIPPAQIALLPRTLTIIRLPWNETISDQEVEDLPPGLVHLDLAYNALITDAAIAKLPRTLTRLSLWNNPLITGACFSHLPNGLIELAMARAKIDANQHFALLPHKLEILDLGNGRLFDIKDVTILPKTLRSINWLWVIPQYKACKAHLPQLLVSATVMSAMKPPVEDQYKAFWEDKSTSTC